MQWIDLSTPQVPCHIPAGVLTQSGLTFSFGKTVLDVADIQACQPPFSCGAGDGLPLHLTGHDDDPWRCGPKQGGACCQSLTFGAEQEIRL